MEISLYHSNFETWKRSFSTCELSLNSAHQLPEQVAGKNGGQPTNRCLESRNLLFEFQAGFRKFHSTLSHLEHGIQTSFMRREHLTAIFFDIEKAFDLTWRYGVLKNLHKWGFRGH
ncbi:hypothetical protein JTB14_008175 [Gonioctena quinquepunctata]|nr:hypothetical protein JTB14_008175 [Gonioctena quinquepunctata]